MKVVVLVPMRAGDPHRDKLWRFAKAWWLRDFPDWEIYEGHHLAKEGPFNRSMAVNRAAQLAGEWDVAVVLDADVIVNPEAVMEAVATAVETNRLVLPHSQRVDLSEKGTRRVLGGYRGNWKVKPIRQQIWRISESSCIVFSRTLWDEVGGFDEGFIGWGYEDTAFRIMCDRAFGSSIQVPGDVFHLWHPRPPDGQENSPTRLANQARLDRLRIGGDASEFYDDGLIPRIFHRTVPERIDPQLEEWWEARRLIHPDWDFRTYRDPIDEDLFPITSPLWSKCETGAQKADLIRLEALVQWGGVYVDSDCRPIGSHEPLRVAKAYAAWEDETTIPNFVMGAVPNHPAMVEALEQSVAGVKRKRKTYDTGVKITTRVFKDRTDMIILPPGSFGPHHYLMKREAGKNIGPWTIEEHCWHHSWGSPEGKKSIEDNQR